MLSKKHKEGILKCNKVSWIGSWNRIRAREKN
jgi:hypothetical protein